MKKILKLIIEYLKPLLYKFEYRRRVKINQKSGLLKIYKTNKIFENFKQYQELLNNIKYPNNDYNKLMSLALSDLEEYIFIIWRFIQNRKKLQIIDKQDWHFRWLGQDKKIFPQHPSETEITNALKIDTKSLFLFGVIVINKSLLLIEKYLPDEACGQYGGISKFYDYLIGRKSKSNLCEKLKKELFNEIKFFRGPLSIFRNKFLQHIERGYQTGFTHGWSTNDFSLTFLGWDIDNGLKTIIDLFKQKINTHKIDLFNIDNDSEFIQVIYDNIEKIPDNLLGDLANLIMITGVRSIHPYQLINNIENYYTKLFKFFIDNIKESELIKYKQD